MIDTPSEPQKLDAAAEDAAESRGSRWTVKRIAIVSSLGLIGVAVVVFVVGLVLALADAERAGAVIQLLRDFVLLVLALEGIFVILGIAILTIQVARLVNLVRSEISPVIDDARDTVGAARATVEFVGSSAAEPIIEARSFIAGVTAFIRELTAIRRAVSPSEPEDQPDAVPDSE